MTILKCDKCGTEILNKAEASKITIEKIMEEDLAANCGVENYIDAWDLCIACHKIISAFFEWRIKK